MHALAHRPAVVKSEASAAPANSGGAMLAAGSPSRTSGPRIAQGNTGVVFYKCKTCMIVSTHSAPAPKPRLPAATNARAFARFPVAASPSRAPHPPHPALGPIQTTPFSLATARLRCPSSATILWKTASELARHCTQLDPKMNSSGRFEASLRARRVRQWMCVVLGNGELDWVGAPQERLPVALPRIAGGASRYVSTHLPL